MEIASVLFDLGGLVNLQSRTHTKTHRLLDCKRNAWICFASMIIHAYLKISDTFSGDYCEAAFQSRKVSNGFFSNVEKDLYRSVYPVVPSEKVGLGWVPGGSSRTFP